MSRRSAQATRFNRTLAAAAVASCFAAHTALANPTGPTVVNGTAAIHQQGNLLQITNSPNAILNWQSFSIGASEITRFIQQSPSSAVLNRVISQNPSTILGALQSNGRVFLINPNGILFGAGAQVDVAGLVASTLNLSNADFLANRLRFTEAPGAGSVVNQGNITTGAGGNVYLVGPAVTNSGLITSPKGEVILAAGASVELVNPGTPNLRVEITAPDNQAVNLGQIVADAGRVGIYAGLIKQSGTIRADSAQVTEDGRIILAATKSVTLDAGSVTTANGPNGGSIMFRSGDTTLVSGTVEAKGSEGKGGTVQVLGNLVGVIESASLDASGDTGGGTVLVGGDFQGKNPDVQNAFRTYVGSDTTIKADAITNGDGGKVIVWSDDATRAYGTLTAKGGASAGNGGFIEISSKNALDFSATVNASAPNGAPGTLLLDPSNIVVAIGGAAALTAVDAFADNAGTTQAIVPATLNTAGTTVVLQATNDITISDPVNLATASAGFIAQAGHDINVNASITTNGGKIHLEADSPHTRATVGIAPDGEGAVKIGTGATITSSGGAITLIAGYSVNKGGFKLGADVNAGNGGIKVSTTNNESAGAPGVPSDFVIGATGSSHLTYSEIGRLQAGAAGTLTLGKATTAGDTGSGGVTARTLTVNSISQTTSTQTTVPSTSGGTLRLASGSGGITLERSLGAFQKTIIDTTGPFNLSAGLNTNNNPLTITALGGINITGGSITTGSGLFTCSAPFGCPSTSVAVNSWNVDASGDWLVPSNWLLGHVPTVGEVALIDRPSGTYTITLGSAGQGSFASQAVGLLVNNEILNLIGNASVKTTLNISPSLVYNGTTASTNTGTMTLTHSVLGGAGRLANQGTFQLTNSSIAAGFSNQTLGALLTANAANTFSGGLGILGGTLNIASGTTIVNGTGLVQSVGTITVSSGATLSADEYDLSGTGSVGGTGSLAVMNDFRQNGGTFGSTFSNIDLSRIGDFAVAGFTATNSIRLRSSTGGITLNGAVSAGGSGDAIVIVGNTFTNLAGAAVLSAPAGRWLVYSGNPASDNRGGLAYDFKQYNATYGVTPVAGSGNGFLYTIAPSITPGLGGTAVKVYGGNTTAPTGSLTASPAAGVIVGDTVSLAIGSASYLDKNVGNNKQVDAGSISIASATDGTATVYGYQLSSTSASANVGTITPAALLVSGVTASNKVYDATTAAALNTGSASVTALGSDVVVLSSAAAKGSFNTKDVGTAKPVTAAGFVISGTDAANYTLAQPTGLTANITPASLSVSGVTANSKVYDATTVATLNTGTASVTPLLTDLVTLSSASATGAFNSKNVGAAKPVTASGFAISGVDAANYTLTQPTGLTANISPAALTYLANTASRERGDPNPVFGGAVSGFVGGETLTTATTGTPSFTSAATQSSVEGQYAINGSGLTALNGNYTFVQAPVNTTALTVTVPVNFTWTSGTGGAWESGSNWNKGFAPVAGAVVTIPDLPGSATITYSSGTTSVKTVMSFEGLTIAGGTLNLGASAADVSTFYLGAPLTLNGGKLGGAGTIIGNVNNVAGTVAPGMSAGVLTINGNYMQGSGGTLAVELGGTAAGTQYDQLVVTGNSTLGGTLSATLVNGFVPASGEAFTIVQSGGTVNGTFAATNLPSTPSFSTNYLVSSVNVTTGGALVPPLAVVDTTTRSVVSATDQSTTSPATTAPPPDEKKDKEKSVQSKKPMCTGGSSGGGSGSTAAPVMAGGGGRCTTRGCF